MKSVRNEKGREMSKRIKQLLSSMLIVAFGLFGVNVPAAAAQEFNVVVLGDSYASGEGIEPYIGQHRDGSIGADTKASDAFLCHRSVNSWGNRFFIAAMKETEIPFTTSSINSAACSGAVTNNVSDLIGEGVRQTKKWHRETIRDIPFQTESLNNNTDLVLLSIGGNDFGFPKLIASCLHAFNFSGDCTTNTIKVYQNMELVLDTDPAERKRNAISMTLRDFAERKLAIIGTKLQAIFADIHARSPHAKVIAFGYPEIFQKNHTSCISFPFRYPNNREIDFINEMTERYNLLLGVNAINSGNYFADVAGEFVGHGLCSPTSSYLFDIEFSRTTDLSAFLPLSIASVHPNDYGAEAYKIAALKVARDNNLI
jgi:hypothetical protein